MKYAIIMNGITITTVTANGELDALDTFAKEFDLNADAHMTKKGAALNTACGKYIAIQLI